MKLHITTQIQENYGAHDWDGVGECPQYWKMKGGNDYIMVVDGFRPDDQFADKNLRMIVDSVREQVEADSVGFREYIVGYGLVEDDFLTEFERDQLEYDGRIAFPSTVLEMVDNLSVW